MEESMHVSSFVPIVRYYEIASRLFESFRMAVEQKKLDSAYVLGKRYAKFCTSSLPTHNYYLSSQPDLKRLRIENHRDLSKVATLLEQVVQMMDQEELTRSTIQQSTTDFEFPEPPTGFPSRNALKSKTAATESVSKLKEPGTNVMKSSRLPHDTALSNDKNYNGDMFHKSVSQNFPSSIPPSNSACTTAHSYMSDLIRPLSLLDLSSSSSSMTSSLAESYALLPTKAGDIEFPTAPGFSSSSAIQKISIAPSVKQHSKHSSPEDTPICIDDLHAVYSQEYEDHAMKKLIQVYRLNTYQGRMLQVRGKDSTNGCTVISPLVIKNHLKSPGPGISDDAIEYVIDSEAPPILLDVRKRLGLQQHALIVPSDVHDYLIERKILLQGQFVGACGGNLLDPEHRGDLLAMLQNGHDYFIKSDSEGNKMSDEKSPMIQTGGKNTLTPHRNCKVGAALFFHEHVISVLKLVFPDGSFWYDLIDSLPSPNVLKEKASVAFSVHSTRIRCKSIEALDATLRWYACSKFTEADKSYINSNIWDDALCDFDPRVFQAFVWANKNQTS